jgi:hypothetical protein
VTRQHARDRVPALHTNRANASPWPLVHQQLDNQVGNDGGELAAGSFLWLPAGTARGREPHRQASTIHHRDHAERDRGPLPRPTLSTGWRLLLSGAPRTPMQFGAVPGSRPASRELSAARSAILAREACVEGRTLIGKVASGRPVVGPPARLLDVERAWRDGVGLPRAGLPATSRRPCRRRGCSWGAGRGSCGLGRSAWSFLGRRGGRRSARRAG